MAQKQQRKVNWFAIWISIGVVVALVVVAALVVWMNNASTGPGEAPKASNVNSETGAIAVGKGSNELDTYIDSCARSATSSSSPTARRSRVSSTTGRSR